MLANIVGPLLVVAGVIAAPGVVILPSSADYYQVPNETTIGTQTPSQDYFTNDSIHIQQQSPVVVKNILDYITSSNAEDSNEGGASGEEDYRHADMGRVNDTTYNILISFVPVIALLVLVFVTCFMARRGQVGALRRFPILNTLFPFQHAGDDTSSYPYCHDQMIDNNVNFIHFMKTLTEPSCASNSPCNCSGCSTAKKNVFPPKTPVPPTPIVLFNKENEQVDIRGISPPADKKMGSVDSMSIATTTGSSSITSEPSEDNTSSSSSGPRFKRGEEAQLTDSSDTSSVIDVNPFNPEYVYAALAPDMQHPSYPLDQNIVDINRNEKNITKGINVKSPPRKLRQPIIFRPNASLETICE